jgi:hypothetical protein
MAKSKIDPKIESEMMKRMRALEDAAKEVRTYFRSKKMLFSLKTASDVIRLSNTTVSDMHLTMASAHDLQTFRLQQNGAAPKAEKPKPVKTKPAKKKAKKPAKKAKAKAKPAAAKAPATEK